MEEAEVNKRIDDALLEERIKSMQPRIEKLESNFVDVNRTVGVCEQCNFQQMQEKLNEFEQRLIHLEYLNTQQENRWISITKYIFQAIWIILLAWTLTKLNLNAPSFS